MRHTGNLLAFAASLAVNLAVLAALNWSAIEAQTPPDGVVSVIQLPLDHELETYASVIASPGP
jgi:hypothetical protein